MFKKRDKFRTSDQIITKALRKFWIFSRQSLVRAFGQVFTKVQTEFGQSFWASFDKSLVRVYQGNLKKVKKRAESLLESMRASSEHAGARR